MELVLSVSSPQELSGTDLRPYDAVCLGNPYCRRVAGNYADDFAALADAVSALHGAGRKAYVTTPAAPRGGDLPRAEALIDAAARSGADALEVHNMGVLRILRGKGNPLPAHMGAFANVYTHLAAGVMRGYGAVRVRPNAEVSLDEMRTIAGEGEVAVEILVHGKIPLGVNEACFLLSAPEGEDPNCPAACREEHWLSARRGGGRDGGWVLKTVGKGILSGKDMCLIEHLPRLLADGFRVFRIEGLYETAAWRSEIGAVYREALDAAASGGPYAVRPSWAEAIRRHSRHGVCNGYCFGKTGRLYVGTVLQGEKS
ncbi:MAG: peptidase U32 family protein [Gemmatimonadota bacterium]